MTSPDRIAEVLRILAEAGVLEAALTDAIPSGPANGHGTGPKPGLPR